MKKERLPRKEKKRIKSIEKKLQNTLDLVITDKVKWYLSEDYKFRCIFGDTVESPHVKFLTEL
jgi:hypothetical protein